MDEPDRCHSAEEIAPRTWRISEIGWVNCYLLEGDDRALLIDAGCGAGDIRQVVETLTEKPVSVVATHRHPDHVGGAWRFGSYLASPADERAVYSLLCSPAVCRFMVDKSSGRKDLARTGRARALPLSEGQTLDLGGRAVRSLAVPGHTAGSVVFLDDDARLMFTGDDVNPNLWMHLPGCTSLSAWKPGAELALSYLERGYSSWYGHGDGMQSAEQVRETIRLASEVIAKHESGELKGGRGCYPDKGVPVVVNYRRI